jgi:C4-dicarboxylate-specific signal transduction histidine kinase
MVPADAAPQEKRLTDTPATDASMSVGQLAHELNSLLDGSLRTLGLALRQLEPDGGSDGSADGVVAWLQVARDAMWQMAELLERAMRDGGATSQVLHRSRPIGLEVPRLLDLVRPMAEAHGVALNAEIGPEAEDLPIGPLGAVLLNGLRNAIQACVRGDREARRVDLSVVVNREDELVIRISDTGPGWPAPQATGGVPRTRIHGLGLGLCRQVVSQLGGRLEAEQGPAGHGAVLQVVVGVRSVSGP